MSRRPNCHACGDDIPCTAHDDVDWSARHDAPPQPADPEAAAVYHDADGKPLRPELQRQLADESRQGVERRAATAKAFADAKDAEAAAVWDGLCERIRCHLQALVDGPRTSRLAIPSSARALLVAHGLCIDGTTPFPTDLGRRVAAHGRAQR